MSDPSIYWYDLESFGRNPRRDRVSQFGGLRTDLALNPIEEPLRLYCRPADDFLPSPESCLITGITPQEAAAKGVDEAEFIARINELFSRPGTCVAGYNNIRFDDELIRQLLYRNFHPPYDRESKNGNSRWDIIDVVRLCGAVRPEGIEWPRRGDGGVDFRLSALCAANGIEHENAHDALSDARATLDLARLIRERQPKLFDYAFDLRDKRKVRPLLDCAGKKAVLHASSRYHPKSGCLAPVMPLRPHPLRRKNDVIVYDLREDPETWMDLSADAIRERVFTPMNRMPEGVARIPLTVVGANKCPVLAPLSVLNEERGASFGVDREKVRKHREALLNRPDALDKVAEAYGAPPRREEAADPDFMLYNGFFGDGDAGLMETVRSSKADDLKRLDLPFEDARLPELLFRYRARNFNATLDPEERAAWDRFRAGRIDDPEKIAAFQAEMRGARERAGEDGAAPLDELEAWVGRIRDGLAETP